MAAVHVQPPPEPKLLDRWSDGISTIHYLSSVSPAGGGSTTRLASTSWDGTVRLHDTAKESAPALLSHNMESGPLFSLAVPMVVGSLVTGGLDGSIKALDIDTTTVRRIGTHAKDKKGSDNKNNNVATAAIENACSCLAAVNGDHPQVVASASWNQQICLWDLRLQNNVAVAMVDLPGKAFSMDVDSVHGRILVGTSGRHNIFYDVRKGTVGAEEYSLEQVLERESSLKFQTRCVKFFPAGHAFCIGSIEGRVGVEYLEELGIPTDGMKKYAFKCHRVGDTVYPVNAIAFHPKYTSTFATGGCDGTVVLWDGLQKKKLVALPMFPTSISAMSFSEDGAELAIASSYTHEEGDREHPKDEIYIRKILDSEAMPKEK
ncbi:WD repeat-containing protein [Nitzschia inconspicua]|uniref:WD repeat-containing protein n=1 Tax=Nitzschia inconspicua TaxID=303405 RepID=A0A9K3PEZ2_9STRA|nr:WD repeat-containing protein [Nitzschia inconspicua]